MSSSYGCAIVLALMDSLEHAFQYELTHMEGPRGKVASRDSKGGYQDARDEEPEHDQLVIHWLDLSAGPFGASAQNGFVRYLRSL